ncbi:UNVERIFIED_CONTAM: Receptor-like protein EIX2 [Sesamum radiatum]|uniref:Receptor-like protein EIX2 n=1 Tax=Sesamum radiatum TaxID=300843 RepID=A0AAW2KAU9_SESRA
MNHFRDLHMLVLAILLVSLRVILGRSSQVDNTNRIRCLEVERRALLKIKHELVDSHGRLSSWADDENAWDCCKWRGVHCHNRTNHVTRVDLHDPMAGDYYNRSPLRGKISTSLLELQHLRYLDLSFNDFEYTPIPEFIGSLTNLRYLKLALAHFSGPIPHHLGNLSKLLYLDLRNNYYCYSENLDWISSLGSLEYIDLSFTNLSKAYNWLQAVSKLTSIKELYLRGDLPEIPLSLIPEINGSSPLAILDLSSKSQPWTPWTLIRWFSNFSSTGLTYISLYRNGIPGPIPDVFENMISLAYLDLGINDLQGGIPKYFGNFSSLIGLYLDENNLTRDVSDLMWNLSGSVEKRLEYLYLGGNNISGLFPNMSNFSSLLELKLQENQLNGSIREGYLRLPRLVSLDLSSNQLTGPIPELAFSSSLKELHLSNNTFNGTLTQTRILSLRQCKLGKYFPRWLKTQKEIGYIDISSTGISDIVPTWFGGIAPNVFYLNASNNQMHGFFPNFSLVPISLRGPVLPYFRLNLMTMDLSRNKISGPLTFLCNVKEWGLLDLSDNLFSGRIPDCFANFHKLTYLNVANNHLSGEIPYSFGALSSLTLLHLRNNSLSGGLPTSMRNCTGLKMIDLGENRLTQNIPAWIGDSFPELIVLILRDNEFYGDVPSNLCRLANLQVLDISSNNVSGSIPDCLQDYNAMTKKQTRGWFSDNWALWGFPLPEAWHSVYTRSFESIYFMWKGKEVKYMNHLGLVKLIDLSNNDLIGEIPSNITRLVGLVGLNVSRNNLVGPIPRDIGQLESLNFLDCSRNHLSGGVPTSLGDLSHLGVLDLSYNNLSGRIPLSDQGLTFDESAYVGNDGLCGRPVNKSCPQDESDQDPYSRADAESKDDDRFITEGFYTAMGLGFVVGFWGIVGTILLNKKFRYEFFKEVNTSNDMNMARWWRFFQNQ